MPERRRAPSRTSERLGRMLTIVPYLVRHDGTTLDDAADLFGVPATQLRKDLELLFMSGLPPYGPGDLIDVWIDDDGSISISMADHFARPLRLTRQEALAVYLRGTELLATPGVPEAPVLASALEKLRGSLGADTLGDVAGIEAAAHGAAPPALDDVRAAAADHHRLRIRYLAASTNESTDRTVDPEEVFSSLGHWYVAAWDVDADGERLFRIDRIREAEPTGESFSPRGLRGAGRPLYSPTSQDVEVRLRLRPAARWVSEYYATTDASEVEDGAIEVTLPSRRLAWVARLVLRLGADVDVLGPPELRDQVAGTARETLARYAD
ncbi:MAG TPA: WYL domain-containing protein [Actinomycetota bacterium]|nr:WYL domain-containing protein [Actinomycetota bacterium]